MGWIIIGSYAGAGRVCEVGKYTVVPDTYLLCTYETGTRKLLARIVRNNYVEFAERAGSEDVITEDEYCKKNGLRESDNTDIASALGCSLDFCACCAAAVEHIDGDPDAMREFQERCASVVVDTSGGELIVFPQWEIYANEIHKGLH